MIVVDTSALMAIILDEPGCEACMAVLEATEGAVMSAGTMAEALIVAARRGVRTEMERLIAGLGLQIAPMTSAEARRVAAAYDQWGMGANPANLNVGDCFAYAVARNLDFPLLFVGTDFARTDIRAAAR